MLIKEVKLKVALVMVMAGLLIGFVPTNAFAHSQLESSTPEDGQTIQEQTDTIELQFSAGIESASTLTLTNEAGEELPVEVNTNGSSLEAKTEEPLANGVYEVAYNILSEDTHPVEGTFSFTVNAEEAEEPEAEAEPETEEPADEENQEEPVEAPDNQVDTEQESSGFSFIWIAVIIVVIGLVAGAVSRTRNRK
ncbi:copper resistance CopC family protein [Alkalicoccobacillus plakortidis]|uniref:Copper resistance protein CopC n=1 Tax=Alkalicoccobacillus plakortidis TaxID=444060 RepID=A0ABT0XPQ7_9BACI|nr:copper resistance protein CopC [Alkalicoccobacillus plakortidis]MCM2677888.1 copper resistance protein CopC [Alkalicoccobacillus plakortidis]